MHIVPEYNVVIVPPLCFPASLSSIPPSLSIFNEQVPMQEVALTRSI